MEFAEAVNEVVHRPDPQHEIRSSELLPELGATGAQEEASDLEAVLTRTWPGMSARKATFAIAEARAKLHAELLEALCLGPSESVAAIEAAFVRYAKGLLTKVAEEARSADVESCLEQLQLRLIPGIVRAIEPDELHHELRFDGSVDDIVGDWEARLNKAYIAFRAERGGGNDAEDIPFRYRCLFRLRVGEHRQSLRSRLNAALTSALIEIEPALRRRLPSAPVKGPRRARGYAAAAEDHFLVAATIQKFDADWRMQLEDVCRALAGEASLPAFFPEEGLETWSEAAESLPSDEKLRRRILDYLKYRRQWAAKNIAKLPSAN